MVPIGTYILIEGKAASKIKYSRLGGTEGLGKIERKLTNLL
jgi:hypothetical protein